jgi:hypothetical protein
VNWALVLAIGAIPVSKENLPQDGSLVKRCIIAKVFGPFFKKRTARLYLG